MEFEAARALQLEVEAAMEHIASVALVKTTGPASQGTTGDYRVEAWSKGFSIHELAKLRDIGERGDLIVDVRAEVSGDRALPTLRIHFRPIPR